MRESFSSSVSSSVNWVITASSARCCCEDKWEKTSMAFGDTIMSAIIFNVNSVLIFSLTLIWNWGNRGPTRVSDCPMFPELMTSEAGMWNLGFQPLSRHQTECPGASCRGWMFATSLKPMIFMEEINTKTAAEGHKPCDKAHWQQLYTTSAKLKENFPSWVSKMGNRGHNKWGNCHSPN